MRSPGFTASFSFALGVSFACAEEIPSAERMSAQIVAKFLSMAEVQVSKWLTNEMDFPVPIWPR
ncbi:hypothetical protein AAW51_0352 [Caldimonas brevitalea]|uniref:Uncharacterized protein n=1 Tax=Caldimonas brevitalea TaxID=413882 RepID=A0A0G3BGE4_9BURK|nr:hypothetical protein AAW51_0352 [Caldimonas brevitalea]